MGTHRDGTRCVASSQRQSRALGIAATRRSPGWPPRTWGARSGIRPGYFDGRLRTAMDCASGARLPFRCPSQPEYRAESAGTGRGSGSSRVTRFRRRRSDASLSAMRRRGSGAAPQLEDDPEGRHRRDGGESVWNVRRTAPAGDALDVPYLRASFRRPDRPADGSIRAAPTGAPRIARTLDPPGRRAITAHPRLDVLQLGS